MLCGADAPVVVSLPEVAAEKRKRARRELRLRRAWSSRGATVLSAVAAAAAMWVATSETSWAHALSQVTAWRPGAVMASASTPEHIVTPSVYEDTLSTAHVAEPTGGVGAPASVLISAIPRHRPGDVAFGEDERDVTAQSDAPQTAALERDDEARRARRLARAKARVEQEAQLEQPALVITPAASDDVAVAVDAERTYDRNLVLNPFDE
jgi:hypothetical protein